MLEFLRDKGLDEDTIVIYTADHGDYACEHGIMEKAPGICADAITRIPFVWRWPGQFEAGHVAEELAEAVDVSATLCSLAGLDALETSDGKDLSRLLSGESGDVRDVAVTEFAWSKSIRKGKHRLVYYPPGMFAEEYPGGFGELYDLEADPWEMKNLYFDPDRQGLIREIERDLLDWLVTTTRPATVLGSSTPQSSQTITRYHNTTNHDLKTHPDRLKEMGHGNYL